MLSMYACIHRDELSRDLVFHYLLLGQHFSTRKMLLMYVMHSWVGNVGMGWVFLTAWKSSLHNDAPFVHLCLCDWQSICISRPWWLTLKKRWTRTILVILYSLHLVTWFTHSHLLLSYPLNPTTSSNFFIHPSKPTISLTNRHIFSLWEWKNLFKYFFNLFYHRQQEN